MRDVGSGRDRGAAGLGTVRNAARLLDEFSYAEPVLGVRELARRLGISRSTAHRVADALAREGFLARTPTGRYRLGLRLLELGRRAAATHELSEIGHRYVDELHRASGETAHLAVLQGHDAVYIQRIENPNTFPQFGDSGQRCPAYASSCGKCLLAHADPAVVDEIAAAGFRRRAARTIASRSALESALAATRQNGYATTYEETYPGMASVGTPVRAGRAGVIAALSISTTTAVMTEQTRRDFTALVRAAAARMSTDLQTHELFAAGRSGPPAAL